MTTRLAVVGMACRYPDATSPRELWENAIAGRRAFRRLPDARMRLEDYWDPDPAAPDRLYARTAGVIEGYSFDRIRYKVAGSTYRSTDLTHWLALDMAAAALADAGFPEGEGLPRERTGVIVGNTLTGEFTRANVMRLRWPYVRRVLGSALEELGWDDERLAAFMADMEAAYKRPFPPIDEDTLAGGLSNTIAGRICNHFDLGGGGYSVDGACSSSLLSVQTACRMLADGDVDAAVAGGVDLSIDPFEMIGFAKTGALAKGEMRVYDRGSNGFWPGEGCGMLVLMREPDAVEAGHRVYATVAGWGASSDGRGGITRPEVGGYKRALRQAYERAGFGIDTVELFEGHGTGTPVGDKNELMALSEVRDSGERPAVIGSIKGMIGHTKAAAGVAGLIKAAMAVHEEMLPPAVGCVEPHELLSGDDAKLRVLRNAESWPAGAPVRAGVTAMGFGGINTHIVLDQAGQATRSRRRVPANVRMKALAASIQDAELLLVDGASEQELAGRLDELIDFVPALSYAQLTDLAVTLRRDLHDLPHRAAVVVSSPEDAVTQLTTVRDALGAGEAKLSTGRAFLGRATGRARIGFLFPGQGSGTGVSGGALRRRFPEAAEAYLRADLPTGGDVVATAVAQPRIVTGSMAGLRVLSMLGIEADVAVGHSLGEISALHWAGVLDEDALLRVAGLRGRTMSEYSASGTMAGLRATPDTVTALAGDLPIVIAGYNGPDQTVIAGSVEAVDALCNRADNAGVQASRLKVSHAFHSPLVAPAAGAFGTRLAEEEFAPVQGQIISTVTGEVLAADTDIPALLRRQIIDPVRFQQAVESAAKDADLLIEVGPGRVLTGLAQSITDVPAVPLDTDDESLRGLLGVAGAAYVAGAPLDHAALFHGRLSRPLEIGDEFTFFASPCEEAPPDRITGVATPAPAAESRPTPEPEAETSAETTLELLRRLAAERAELPREMVTDDSLLLDDLHMSSITVGKVVEQAVQRLGGAAAHVPANFATATVRELAEAIDEAAESFSSASATSAASVEGAAPWARAFSVDLDEVAIPTATAVPTPGPWRVYAPDGHAFAEALRRALEEENVGPGVLVCLSQDVTESDLEGALLGAKAALGGGAGHRFVLVQQGRGAAGLAKTLRLEAPHLRVTIVHLPSTVDTGDAEAAVARVVAEVAATTEFTDVYYDEDGVRRVPTLRAMPVSADRTEPPLNDSDVLLVTGGGKGITAECALTMATAYGSRLALLGRSDPAQDEELAANLRRMADAGLTVRYVRADVTDAGQVRDAITEAAAELGPITAVLHGAGRNDPGALVGLDMDAFRRTFAPKIDGLRAVLDAIDPARVRLLVTFGSIIGRAGLRGEAHYATANEWLADITEEWGRRHPNCRVLCMEWSVWSEVGMGERLSVIDPLIEEGITPISPGQGVSILRRLLEDRDAPTAMVISGRTGEIDTVRYEPHALPLLRFTDRSLVHYPGVELVTEAELKSGTDLYLDDHALDGNLLFPAVFGMEAMAQVAAALTGREDAPVIEGAEFLRPIVVAPDGTTEIRIAAAVTEDDTVEVAIRSAETVFAADHFRARLRYGRPGPPPHGAPEQVPAGLPDVPLDPAADMYGELLFQGSRFQRLRTYHRAAARHVDAEVAALPGTDWFSAFLPGELLLADPGVRDALMHGNQVCVPHATLLPTGVDLIHSGGSAVTGTLRYCAVERDRDGDKYVYDIAVRTEAGDLVERWDGLRLQAVRKQDGRGPWAPPLLGPYLERMVGDLVGADVAVAVEPIAGEVSDPSIAIGRALGRPAEPDAVGDRVVAASCGAGVTLAVVAEDRTACRVAALSELAGLDGSHSSLIDAVAAGTGEARDTTAARVVAAADCLAKADVSAPLALDWRAAGPWTVFTAGPVRVVTLTTSLVDAPEPVVFAILTEGA